MNKAYQFNMISRTVGEQLPDCIFYEYSPDIGYKIEFYSDFDSLCDIPLRLDIAIENRILVGDACQIEIRKNGRGYIAEYHAYALHTFIDDIPS